MDFSKKAIYFIFAPDGLRSSLTREGVPDQDVGKKQLYLLLAYGLCVTLDGAEVLSFL
jgi:hypothetical protein